MRRRRPGPRPAAAASAYAPQEGLTAPARGRSELWRVLLGLALIELLFTAALYGFDEGLARIRPALAGAVLAGDTAPGLVLQLASYGFLGIATAFVTETVQRRPAEGLLGPRATLWPLLRRGFLGAMAFYVILQVLPPWSDVAAIERVRPAGAWALALPFGLLALLVQTASEEILYRGYLQQAFAARHASPLLWMVLPNLVFASVHWTDGGDWVENWQYVIWAFCFGLCCSDLVARTGSLGPAIGLHLANNAYAFLFFAEAGGPDSGLALLLFPATPELPVLPGPSGPDGDAPILTLSLAVELAVVGLAWLSTRLAIRR